MKPEQMKPQEIKPVPVVLCGGSGTRLWPLSRSNHPKQFAPLLGKTGGETLFRRTMDRIGGLDCHPAIIVCNRAHRFFVADALREAERGTILLEPSRRNTAPAATLAALSARDAFGDALLLIMPSDHLITAPDAFAEAIADATPAAQDDQIVVFGVTPDRAESEYGYIHTDAGETAVRGGKRDAAQRVVGFHEKPDRQTAAEWIERGNCYWNSGLFLVKASVYLNAIAEFEPDIGAACEQAWEKRYDDLGFICVETESFSRCRSISIDYAVVERADNVMMVPVDMGWNDLGSWNALSEVFALDGDGNRVRGDVLLKNATGNIVHSDGRLVSVLGVDDCIIADTADAVLIAARKYAPEIRELVAEMQENHRPEADEQRKVFRPWGYYESLHSAENFQVKRIMVKPGHGLSLQLHHHRSEHWVVVKGKARVTRGDEVFTLAENESTYIPARVQHRLENVYDEPVRLIEVQCGDYLGEDDIVRLDDRYGRAKPPV